MTRITLAKIGKNRTVDYAVDELYAYLKRIDNTLFVDVRCCDEYNTSLDRVIWVGESDCFSSLLISVDDKRQDDSIYINVRNNSGIITGCNPRSVLIAVYRFLRELGVAWVRPTDDGEIVPEYKITDISVDVKEKASYRHRAICIEGEVGYEHVLEMIKWIPRIGMSGYFFQFFIPWRFMDKWYNVTNHENVTRADVMQMFNSLVEELKKRDLVFHHVGHGWTSTPFGFEGNGGYPVERELTEDDTWHLALIKGKREFRGKVPNWTNLCYSNPRVREIVVNAVVDYCKSTKDVDLLHFWLGDGEKNSCECENCIKLRPSDYYVMMLNDLDKKLDELGINTKIVFLTYADATWAPVKERLKNKERFTLMLAPGGRSYSHGFEEISDPTSYEEVPYERNVSTSPSDIKKCARLLSEWQKMFDGDSFDFDYHLFARQWRDLGGLYIAKRVFVDMQNLDRLSLNGMVSCQVTRNSFPTALPTYMMAMALWNKKADFEAECTRYFKMTFGEKGTEVKGYLEALSNAFNGEKECETLENAEKLISITEEFRPFIDDGMSNSDENMKASWQYLLNHNEMVHNVGVILKHKYSGDAEKSAECREKLFADLRNNELGIHKVLDVSQFILRMTNLLTLNKLDDIFNA